MTTFFQSLLSLPGLVRARPTQPGRARTAHQQQAISVADAARDRADWPAAADAYAAVVKELPDGTEYWGQLGNVLKECRRFGEAEAAYTQCLQLAPGTADSWLQLGHLFKLQQRIQDATYAYLQALRFDANCLHALHELQQLGWSIADVVATLPGMADFDAAPTVAAGPAVETGLTDVILDVSDLVAFLQHFRRPTGIQRVSLSLLTAWLNAAPEGVDLRYAVLDSHIGGWRPVRPDLLKEVCERTVGHLADDAALHIRSIRRLLVETHRAPPIVLSSNSVLLNVGSSTGIPNYHLHVRNAKARFGLRYVQFTHDCIPLIMPQYFVPEHVPEFLDAMVQALHVADGFLVNSSATGKDLLTVARRLALSVPQPHVVRLDGSLLPPEAAVRPESSAVELLLASPDPYVLFVSTIEPRKNHILALETWARMVRERPAESVPRLVCVGNWGWKYEAVRDFLEQHEDVARRVRILSSVSDGDLNALYRHCAFVIYPSLYEGWGLPVAEALEHGKLPVVARTSSLPEAGGRFAEYFDPKDPEDFATKVARLIDDPAFVRRREEEIRRDYAARSWSAIGSQILSALATFPPRDPEGSLKVRPGYIYSLARERRQELAADHLSGLLFKYGQWRAVSDTGSGLSASGSSELRVMLPSAASHSGLLLKAKAEGVPFGKSTWLDVDVEGDVAWSGGLQAGQERWIRVALPTTIGRSIRIGFRIASSERGNSLSAGSFPQIEICGFACLPASDDDGSLATTLRALLDLDFLAT